MADLELPEHDKIKALNGANQTVGDFIEWLGTQRMEIAVHDPRYDCLVPCLKSRDALIASFFDINPVRLEAEKVAILEEFRKTV